MSPIDRPSVSRSAAVGQAEEPAFGVCDLGEDATPARFVDDDPRIGVEPLVLHGPAEQALIDRVLPLNGEHGDPFEAELFIQGDGLRVVVDHRQIHESPSAIAEMLRQTAHQGLTDPRLTGLRIDGQTPERRTALRIAERLAVVHPHHHAQHLAARGVDRQQIGQRGVVLVSAGEIGRRRHHLTGRPHPHHFLGLLSRPEGTNLEARQSTLRRPQVLQHQAEGVGRIQEQLLGGQGDDHVRIRGVQGDVPAVRRLRPQRLDQIPGFRESLTEQQPPPAALEHHVATPRRGAGAQRLLRPRGRVGAHHVGLPQTPWVCSHSSSAATCQSSEPLRGVMCPVGSAKSRSRYSWRKRPRSRAACDDRASRTMSR